MLPNEQRKTKKRLREHDRNLSYEEKIKKEIMLTLEIKIYQTQTEKKQEYMKSQYYKWKKLLNDLINPSKLIFKIRIF